MFKLGRRWNHGIQPNEKRRIKTQRVFEESLQISKCPERGRAHL